MKDCITSTRSFDEEIEEAKIEEIKNGFKI